MAIIPKSFDDLLIDKMVTALQAFSTDQVLIDPAVGFNVMRDITVEPLMRDMPLINIWLDGIQPVAEGSSAKRLNAERYRINVDCYSKGLDADQLDECFDDDAASARLYYLKEQAKYGLYRLINVDFGFAVGTIARKGWPSWQVFKNALQLPEQQVIAGRWSLEVEANWTPEDVSATDLEQITVDADIWGAIYNYPQGD